MYQRKTECLTPDSHQTKTLPDSATASFESLATSHHGRNLISIFPALHKRRSRIDKPDGHCFLDYFSKMKVGLSSHQAVSPTNNWAAW
jgi:hypothetical protein